MTDRWQRIVELHERASELPPEEREAFLREECGDDHELFEEVWAMFAQETPESFLRTPLDPPPEKSGALVGQTLGQFKLLEEIGRGGMGVVYSAQQLGLDRKVAVKVLPALHRADEQARDRFRREARAASKLDHPHAVGVLANGTTDDFDWFAMRRVEGHDAQKELQIQRNGESKLLPGFGSAAYITKIVAGVADLADALQAAHELQIVHRDVKPQNILLDADGGMHLADFGLARDESLGTFSATGEIKGTPHYMSPEQARALKAKVDSRTDIYSLSAVLYEFLCLHKPYEDAGLREILARIAAGAPRPLRKINSAIAADLTTICEKGMSRLPEDRYATAGDFADDLRRFLRREAILASPPSAMRRAREFAFRHPRAIAAGAAAVLSIGATTWVVDTQNERSVLAGWQERIEPALEGDESRYADAKRAADEYRAQEDIRSEELWDLILRLSDHLDDHKEERLAEVLAQHERGRGGELLPFDDNYGQSVRTAASPQESFQAVLAARELQELFDDSEEIAELASLESLFPLVSIRLAPDVPLPDGSEATAYFRRIDSVQCTIGDREPLGPLPIEDLQLPPGEYRFVVDVEDYGFAEMYRLLTLFEGEIDIEAKIRPTSETRAGAVLIPGGEFRLRKPEIPVCCHHSDRASVAPFWIDEAEVSNGDFVRFIEETGYPLPRFWTTSGATLTESGVVDWSLLVDEQLAPLWPDLPITGLSWGDAQAYAEWVGKRLPTHLELERAQRGTEGRLLPWDRDTPDDAKLANVSAEDLPPDPNGHGAWGGIYRTAMRQLLPVRAPGYKQPPSNLYHSFGNATEWTESPLVEPKLGRLMLDPWKFMYLGGDALPALGQPQDLSTHAASDLSSQYIHPHLGFRCAKSDEPG